MKPVSTPLPANPVAASPEKEIRPDANRRRFIIGGLVAAPLLVTLSARPAWAQQCNGTLGNYCSQV
jgi:hypothetical protein